MVFLLVWEESAKDIWRLADGLASPVPVRGSTAILSTFLYSELEALTALDGMPLVKGIRINRDSLFPEQAVGLFTTDQAIIAEGVKYLSMPSTSPANAAYGMERLCGRWRKITEYIRTYKEQKKG